MSQGALPETLVHLLLHRDEQSNRANTAAVAVRLEAFQQGSQPADGSRAPALLQAGIHSLLSSVIHKGICKSRAVRPESTIQVK